MDLVKLKLTPKQAELLRQKWESGLELLRDDVQEYAEELIERDEERKPERVPASEELPELRGLTLRLARGFVLEDVASRISVEAVDSYGYSPQEGRSLGELAARLEALCATPTEGGREDD